MPCTEAETCSMRPSQVVQIGRPMNLAHLKGRCMFLRSLVRAYSLLAVMRMALPQAQRRMARYALHKLPRDTFTR